MLEDRCSLVILVRETAHQQKIQEYRDLHRRQGDEIKKKDHAALDAAQKAGQHPPGRAAHPLGSQRSLFAHVRAQRDQCSGASGYGRQRRGEGDAQVADSAARRVLCQTEGEARQAERGQAVGVVVDARGGCACGGEGRAPDDCAVVEGKPDRAGEGYTDCATALAGWAHREGHPEGATEAGGRAESGRRRRGRRDGQPWWQSWPEAWEKIVMAGYGREARAGAGASTRTCTDAWEFIPSKLQNSLNSGCMRRKDGVGFAVYALRVLDDVRPTTENFTWPAGARGALRRCAGWHRPPWRRRGRPVVILVIGGSRGRYTPKLLGPPRHPAHSFHISFGQPKLRVLARPEVGESVSYMCFPPGL